MATRATPTSYYYSGQGRLMIGTRNATTGKGEDFREIGNVTSLTVDISVDKLEHKESMSGARAIDLTIIKEKKATCKFTCESLSIDNLALGLYGTSTTTASTPIVDEPHVWNSGIIALDFPNATALTVKVGVTTAVIVTDYTVDLEFGTVRPVTGSTVITTGSTVLVSYTSGIHKRMDVFTQATPPERFLRFEGLNTVNGDLVLLELPRTALEPMTGLEFINDEIGKADLTGNILLDTFITTGSQFMIERIITPA